MNYSISSVIGLPFDQALRETRSALSQEEFVVITEIDLKAELASRLGQKIRPYIILGVWVPSWEYEALMEDPDVALLMPSHLCLWDNGDNTCTVATADLNHLCLADDKPRLSEAARAINARLRAVVGAVQFAAMTTHARGRAC
jgi:uncharacterized protein (DUF302 family)